MVTYDGEDVTSQAAITNVTTGEPVENAAWTTTEIGEYKFQAVYDSYTSDPVTVSAIDKNKDKDKEFYRYVLLLKFTYMTCGNCVTAQGYFDALDEADRDHFLVVAAHQPEGMPMDPYWCSEGISLKSKMKVGVYPTDRYGGRCRYAGRNCSGGAHVQFRGDDRGGLECRELRLRGLCIQRGGQWQVYCQ